MFENVRSSYILGLILSHITEAKKLKIIIYNKELQKKINIHLMNYKLLSGKYIINESKGIVKEYNAYNDYLIFGGEYKNGKRNGKSIEYNKYLNGKLIYEGEYLDGKKNGIGKEYYDDLKLRFEGEYLNGKIWNGKGYDINQNICYGIINGEGVIKEYNDYGTLIFEGTYVNGEKNGKGKEYNTNYWELQFKGEYLNGIKILKEKNTIIKVY